MGIGGREVLDYLKLNPFKNLKYSNNSVTNLITGILLLAQISVTLKEWDIPYDELVVGEQIGVGRFGIVSK